MSQWRLNDDDFEDDDHYSKTNVEKKADAPWTHWGQGHFKVTILFIFYFPKKLKISIRLINIFLELAMNKRNANAIFFKAKAPLCLDLVTVWYLHSNYSHYFFLIADLSGVYWDVNSNKRSHFALISYILIHKSNKVLM